jgi:indolepyruvate ferredoxin oxidoreductase
VAEYQDCACARRYREFVEQARAGDAAAMPGRSDLTEAVAQGLLKFMAYKDVYEIARVMSGVTSLKTVADRVRLWGQKRLAGSLPPEGSGR